MFVSHAKVIAPVEELSEEDQQLKSELEMLMDRLVVRGNQQASRSFIC